MKKAKRIVRKRRRRGEPLEAVQISLRIRKGEAVLLADLIKRIERERWAVITLMEALQAAGIKPSSGRWFDDGGAP
jgi:hypothetical protein